MEQFSFQSAEQSCSLCRWEPPVFPGVPAGYSDGGKKVGSSSRVESAFAHSSYPSTFAGWDKVRAASEAEEKAVQAMAGGILSRLYRSKGCQQHLKLLTR